MLIKRQTPTPKVIKEALDIPIFGRATGKGVPPFAVSAHSHAEVSGHTIPVLIKNGRKRSLKAANAKNPPTGVTISTTRGNVSENRGMPKIVPKPSGSRKNASKTRAKEYPRHALKIFLWASQKSTVNPSEITASTMQLVVIRSIYAFILAVISGTNACAKNPKIATKTDTIIINKEILWCVPAADISLLKG